MNQYLTILFTLFSVYFGFACTFDGNQTNAGSLTPNPAYQTQTNISSGNYFSVAVSCGSTYNFNFCNNGGSAGWDTQITILQTDGITTLAYNDDACGLSSDLSWTSTFNGTIYVLISQYSCNNTGGSTGATLAYNVTPGASNPSFTMTSTGCTTASANITGDSGGTFSFNPAPGDAAIINPSTGAISNGTSGASYTVQYTVSCGVNSTQNVTLSSSGSSAFSLSVVCGGANATISGSPGGTFSFNPNPGDGAQVNASSGSVTNGTAGTTYFVQYTVCGNSTTQSATVIDDNCWTLNGNAQYINVAGEQCIQLTDEINNQTGCAWNGSTIDFASDFTLTLDYYFGNNINGADGNTFTFQPSSSTACGQNGGQLGAGGIANSLAIEFDTYDNDNPTHLYDMSCDHIAVEIDGNMLGPGAPYCGPVCAKPLGGNIDDGGTYTVDISWDASAQQLQVFFGGILRLSCNGDFVNTVFGGQSQVYWGATSATGGLNNQQYFCPSTVVILPVELTSFSSNCDGENESFNWTTASENRVDYFQLEYTYDGLVFIPEGKIDAIGFSQENQSYTLNSKADNSRQRYYRLKIVDDNGEYKYTDLIASQRCGYAKELITGVIQDDLNLSIITGEEANITLLNQLGQTIYTSETFENIVRISKLSLSGGVYFVIAKNAEGMQQSEKILVQN